VQNPSSQARPEVRDDPDLAQSFMNEAAPRQP
jgi:hypothetical protein